MAKVIYMLARPKKDKNKEALQLELSAFPVTSYDNLGALQVIL
jgi:hypothetical protein